MKKKRTMHTDYRSGQHGSRRHPLSLRGHQGRGSRNRQSGAALVIALSILLVLLSLAITFILIVRFESTIAQQSFDRARAEHLLDAALAQAQYRLNRDLEMHSDALSLDHGWRSWFSGAAFVGKDWTRQFQGIKSFAHLYDDRKGLVAVSIEGVEQGLRNTLLGGGLLYVRFTADNHIEPLFRGPRTEHWLHVPRRQGNVILIFAPANEVQLINAAGTALTISQLNNGLAAAGRPERFDLLTEQITRETPGRYPFVTSAFMNDTDNPAVEGLLPQEQVNHWADVDSTGDGMRDALWMPIARDINHYGDGIDNTLDGTPDPMREEGGLWTPLFEPAPFVYHGLGLPDAAKTENPEELADLRGFPWDARERLGDGFDNDNSGVVDGPTQDRLFLTVPLPGLLMPVDLNNDGIFDERDHYPSTGSPVFVRLPDTLYVPVLAGVSPTGDEILGRVPVTITNLDVLDNDHDLVVNNFRSYAYFGPRKPGYHEINVDAVLQSGRGSLSLLY